MVGYPVSRYAVGMTLRRTDNTSDSSHGVTGLDLIYRTGCARLLPWALVARQSSARQRAYRDGSPGRRVGGLIDPARWLS